MAANSEVTTTLTLGEAAGRYLSSAKDTERPQAQAELNRFVRHFGTGILTWSLRPIDVEDYQEKVEKTGADVARRLEPLKGFLVYLHKQGWTQTNLGRLIKTRRAAATNRVSTRRNGRSASADDEVVQLTSEGYTNLKNEHTYLTTVKRDEIARELFEARIDKDFRENAPYDAAKTHQAEIETRIRLIERMLAVAQVVDQQPNLGDTVAIGTTVILNDLTHGEELTYTLVGTNEANPQAGRISVASPVGRAMIDRQVGDEIEVAAPMGAVRYQIQKIVR
ncbi:MAG TPA: transcription elongation factor GreA [Chloroflexota bacterium]|nr:transcription elongation factor GreA [Chloroflexota bacterium]